MYELNKHHLFVWKKKNLQKSLCALEKIEKLIFLDSRGKVTIQILKGMQKKIFHIK